MENNSRLPFLPHSSASCSATERHLLLSFSVFSSKAFLNIFLYHSSLIYQLQTLSSGFWLWWMRIELFTALFHVAGVPQSLGSLCCHSYVRLKDKEVCLGAVCMGGHWKGLVRARMGAGVGLATMLWVSEMPGCWSFLSSGAPPPTLAASILFSSPPIPFPSSFLSPLKKEKDFIYLFLEGGEERRKERERNINVWLPLTHTPTGHLACNHELGMCPDGESNRGPFG